MTEEQTVRPGYLEAPFEVPEPDDSHLDDEWWDVEGTPMGLEQAGNEPGDMS